MDLATVSMTGFRRFKTKNTLQTNGKLVAILGPNEAGKSSILRAIELLGSDNPPASRDFCRATARSAFEITGRFYLSEDDIKAAGLSGPHWLSVTKKESGIRAYKIDPNPPLRDRKSREALLKAIDSAFLNNRFLGNLAAYETEIESSISPSNIYPILKTPREDLTEDQILNVEHFVAEMTPVIDDKMTSSIRSIPQLLKDFLAAEKSQNPRQNAINVLQNRTPQVVVFGEDARNLLPEYDISLVSSNIPLALDNLLDLAELKVDDIIRLISEGDQAKLSTLELRANATLERNFSAYWQQSKSKVSLKILVDRLHIHVVNEDSEHTSFAERSDGLRQFVALISFASGRWSGKPIMLIDEAEQRLHYDAQADLVQMLGRQQVASKIIYTTHSAGCLPEDLGNGVHLAYQVKGDESHSKINNKFWDASVPGFTPLLFGMGASTMAYFPTRHAVMVEGPSDMLLMPTLARHALGVDVLGYQFVPGLSYTDGFIQSPAMGKTDGVLYLVDGDDGGETIKAQLVQIGVPKANVLVLATTDKAALEVEDFLRPDLLIEGLNNILKKFHPNSALAKVTDLPEKCRMAWVEQFYKKSFNKKIAKIALAYEILDIINDNPSQSPLDPKRAATFKSIVRQISARFDTKKSKDKAA